MPRCTTPAGADVTMDTMTRPDRATFRLPTVALFVPVLLFFCIAPLATAGGAWALLFAVPALAVAWVIITRTSVTPDRLTAHGLLGSRRMSWTDLDRLEFKDSRWAIAVALDGRRLRLPMVRPRDLPRLTAVSGGGLHLGDDAPAEDQGSSAEATGPAADPAPTTQAAESSAESSDPDTDRTHPEPADRPPQADRPAATTRPGVDEDPDLDVIARPAQPRI